MVLWAVGALVIAVLSAIPLIVSFLPWREAGHWGHAYEPRHPVETGGQPLSERDEPQFAEDDPGLRHDATAMARDGRLSSAANAFVLVLAFAAILAVIYVYAPLSLEDVATLRWLDDINVIPNRSPASAKQEVFPVDPTAVANVSLHPRQRANRSVPPAPADSSHSNPLLGQACASERAELDRLRQEPSAEAAGLFWRNVRCEGLRPQVRLLLESLNVAADSVGSAAAPSEPETRGTTSDSSTAIGVDPADGRRRNPTSATPSASPAP